MAESQAVSSSSFDSVGEGLMCSDKTLLIAHVVLACILGVFAGGLYYQVGVTIAGFQNRVGSLFFLGSLIAFSSLRLVHSFCKTKI